MKKWFALSAIGRDRPGIVADLAELIYECDCNLEDSSMTLLGSEFAVLLLLTGEEAMSKRASRPPVNG
jgi:glycine cleavage system transcriptional repressor